MSTEDIDQAIIERSLSQARLTTYSSEVRAHNCNALQMYTWNAKVAADFLFPLHFCEVVIRNAVSEAITSTYEERWPWSVAFHRSLPNSGKYRQRQDLENTRRSESTTGKVIPELKFVFWQKMFTSRFDERLWQPQLNRVFPHLPTNQSVETSREEIYQRLEQVRKLRNRIAHHEPIFKRDLASDYQAIELLIRWRCPQTADWMHRHQQVTTILAQDPRISATQTTSSPKKYVRSTRLQKQLPDLRQRTRLK